MRSLGRRAGAVRLISRSSQRNLAQICPFSGDLTNAGVTRVRDVRPLLGDLVL